MKFSSRLIALQNENVDTDQIVPARFLKTSGKTGLGEILLYDWRYNADGSPRPDFILNRPEMAGAKVLLAGDNFGCGSSREHAPWALADYGFRVLVSTSFADIFCSNCLKNGILPIIVDKTTHQKMFRLAEEFPAGEVSFDLEQQTLVLQDGEIIQFPVNPFSKRCLLEGIDEMGYLLKFLDRIAAYEALNKI